MQGTEWYTHSESRLHNTNKLHMTWNSKWLLDEEEAICLYLKRHIWEQIRYRFTVMGTPYCLRKNHADVHDLHTKHTNTGQEVEGGRGSRKLPKCNKLILISYVFTNINTFSIFSLLIQPFTSIAPHPSTLIIYTSSLPQGQRQINICPAYPKDQYSSIYQK